MPERNPTPRPKATPGTIATIVAVAAMVVALVWAAPATAQTKPYPIFTVDQFVSAMKTVGLAFTAVNASLTEGNVEDAKAYLSISRERLATTITFWRDRQKDDAIAALRDTLTKLDELDVALSTPKADLVAAAAVAKRAQSGCQACHALYREQDATTKGYRLKPELTR